MTPPPLKFCDPLEGGTPPVFGLVTLRLDRRLGGGALGDVIEGTLHVHGHGVQPGDDVIVPDDGPRHGREHVREAPELVVRVEEGDEEGLGLLGVLGVLGREEPFLVVDNALGRQGDAEVG